MPNPTKRLTRRNFLKSTAYASALSVSGLSGLALADSLASPQSMPDRPLSTVTLLNQSNKAVTLNAVQPVSLEKIPGWVVVKLNKATEQEAVQSGNAKRITLAAGQRRSFVVDAELVPALKERGSHIVSMNDYDDFDKQVPMATFDVVVV